MHVAKQIALLKKSERRLGQALMLIADRHHTNPEVRDVAKTLATWSFAHVERIERFEKKYGKRVALEPDWLRSALFHDPRFGGLGFLRDMEDVGILAQSVHFGWVGLFQAAESLRDAELEALCRTAGHETDRQISWIGAHVKTAASQALTVKADKKSEIAATKTSFHPAALPDSIWAPATAALLILLVGVASVIFRSAFLLPSLGPTAYLAAHSAAHPSARAYNAIAGHVIALAIGFLALWMVDAWGEPSPLRDQQVSMLRVLASALAMLLLLAVSIPLRASHPPAAATVLLVTLGAVQTLAQAAMLAAGAVIVGLSGAGMRQVRLGRLRHPPERAKLGVGAGARAPSAG